MVKTRAEMVNARNLARSRMEYYATASQTCRFDVDRVVGRLILTRSKADRETIVKELFRKIDAYHTAQDDHDRWLRELVRLEKKLKKYTDE